MPLTKPPAPGIYDNVAMDGYNGWDTARSGHINALVQGDPPAKVRHNTVSASEGTESQRMGTATHTKVFQPERFDDDVAIWTGKVRRGKEWDAFRDAHQDCEVNLNGRELDLVVGMREAVMADPAARSFIEADGRVELSAVVALWYDDESGKWRSSDDGPEDAPRLNVKGRADHLRLTDNGVITDLKTCAKGDKRNFEASIGKFGYDYQGRLYQKVYTALGLPTAHHVIIAVENTPPHIVNVYRLTDMDLADCDVEMVEPMLRLAKCYADNKWPGGPGIVQDVSRPAWKARLAEGLR